ncbi:hypothetical protein Efla_004564 [Eimeria flavescens]
MMEMFTSSAKLGSRKHRLAPVSTEASTSHAPTLIGSSQTWLGSLGADAAVSFVESGEMGFLLRVALPRPGMRKPSVGDLHLRAFFFHELAFEIRVCKIPLEAWFPATSDFPWALTTQMRGDAALHSQAPCTPYAPDRRESRLVLRGTPREQQNNGISLPWALLALFEPRRGSVRQIMRYPHAPPVASPSSPSTSTSRLHSVSLDVLGPIITKSLAAPGGNTCILVFMDQLTKMLRLAACPQQLSAGRAAALFIEHLLKHHGLLERLLPTKDHTSPQRSGITSSPHSKPK